MKGNAGAIYTIEKLFQRGHTKATADSSAGDDLGAMLMEVLGKGDIRTVFQPIVSLKNGSVMGYEALSRGPCGSAMESPAVLFDVVRIHDKLWELEFLCRIKALENVSRCCPDSFIFLNVDPAVINDDKFKKGFTKEFLKQYNISPQNVVFEITEKNSVGDFSSFRRTINHYKNQGYKIAIDDTGSGYSGLMLISEIHPHFIKLDMNLIRDVDKDGLKSALIKTMRDFCVLANIVLIAEGIETENELSTLIDIGVEYGQGYFIQWPEKSIQEIRPELIRYLENKNGKKDDLYGCSTSDALVGDICREGMYITPTATGAHVLEIFSGNPGVFALPVISGGKVVGIIMKESFYASLGTKYGFTLYLNRPMSLLMDNHPLVVSHDTTIDVVSKIAMTRGDEHLYDSIVVTKHGEYLGVVTVKDLLEKTTEMKVNHAKHLNPLSGLPGNIIIEKRLSDYLKENVPFTVIYIDIDNFKVYNDVYGFENGDKMLQALVRVLSGCVAQHCPDGHFTGHIGGDDFVVCINGYDAAPLCEAVIAGFKSKLGDFYSLEDVERGYVMAKNRRGTEERFGLVTLSIACVNNKSRVYKDVFALSEHATKIKKKCKEVWDNFYVID